MSGPRNPGVRVELGFVRDSEEEQLIQDCRILLTQFGSDYIAPHMRGMYEQQLSHLDSPTRVNTWRATGRPQGEDDPIAKWKYGHYFDKSELPKSIQNLIERIQNSPKYAVGKCRDVVIEQRLDKYFRTDPHIHPSLDAPEVFIITLLSDTVLTLTNPHGGERHQEVISRKSFTPADVDVLHRQRASIHLTGAAREQLAMAVRQGVDGKTGLSDWFGSPVDH